MTGKLIVIDGTDGSGKASQTKLLVARLEKDKVPVKTNSFPTYGSFSCKGVEGYLNGEFGDSDYVGPFYGSMFYAFNRFKETVPMRADLKEGINYVLDRYVSANAGHQGGKISDDQKREEYLSWLFDLEFNRFGIPEPDLTFFLHAPPVVGQQFLAGKTPEERAYITSAKKRDIHEVDLTHLANAEKSYIYVARKYPNWITINCVRPELADKPEILNDLSVSPLKKVRPLDEMHEEIYRHACAVLTK